MLLAHKCDTLDVRLVGLVTRERIEVFPSFRWDLEYLLIILQAIVVVINTWSNPHRLVRQHPRHFALLFPFTVKDEDLPTQRYTGLVETMTTPKVSVYTAGIG